MKRLSTIEIKHDSLRFSAGHFTIFSATERERLHGHNYKVIAKFQTEISNNGLEFDYRHFRLSIAEICKSLHLYLLLPTQSEFLQINEEGDYWIANFNKTKLPFLKSDVKLLPISNVTIEELSYWILKQLLQDPKITEKNSVHQIIIQVFNGDNQSATAEWQVV